MTQGERVKNLRKTLGLTLEKFGERIGVGKTTISNIENDYRNLTEHMTKSICREFSVDYIWLTTGKGEMFFENDNLLDEIDDVLAGESNFHKNILKFVARLSDEDLIALERMIDNLSEILKEEND